ncbi:MAG: cadherin-like beta sandwich domain-containing protein [Holophagales bacterium]|jgi:hypothetical protein|nr:cadherin-like beta sandwich domain-containing protein [Holophagales bacterium]
MPNKRYMPKWLAFLIPITLSLTLLSAVGCSSDDDKVAERPEPSQETGISNITVAQGNLLPAFSDDVRNYAMPTFYTATPNLTVTVTLKDARSRLTIDGRAVNSGQSTAVPLNDEGNTTIQISVQAEDGYNFNVVTLTTKQIKPSTTVYVYDSVAGNLLDGDVRLSLRDARTNETLASDIAFPVEAQGTVFLGLEKNRRYNIYARRHDTAEACFADFDPSREDTVTLYSRKDWTKAFPATAPIITDIAFSYYPASGLYADLDWKSVPPGSNYVAETAANLNILMVTAMAESSMAYTQGGADCVSVNVDDTPTSASERKAPFNYLGTPNTRVIVDGKWYMTTSFLFDIGEALAPGEHFLDIVAYDWANNRTEQRVYLNITNTSAMTDFDLSGVKPLWYRQRANTYGISMSPYSKGPVVPETAPMPMSIPPDPVGPYGDSIQILCDLNFTTPGVNLIPSRGWELERSTSNDPSTFKVVRRASYINPVSYLATWDSSAELVGGVTYYYRMRAYNNNGYSQYSDISAITVLPSFNVNLVSPEGVSNTLHPAFKFKITSDALLNKDMSDYAIFTLFVRNKIGFDTIKTLFVIDYEYLDSEGNPVIWLEYPFLSNDWHLVGIPEYDEETGYLIAAKDAFVWLEANGSIVIDTKLANKTLILGEAFDIGSLEPGAAYEWNIFGDYASADGNWSEAATDSMYFTRIRDGYNTDGTPKKQSRSFASTADQGSGATNGYFTLIMHPAAE